MPEQVLSVHMKLIYFFFSQTLALDLELDPEEIRILADKIESTVSQLENVESIIDNTRYDLERVENLKELANRSK